jgi:hypothetical protein
MVYDMQFDVILNYLDYGNQNEAKLIRLDPNMMISIWTYVPRHNKTNIMGLRPAWIQTSLRIRAVW